LVDAELGCSWLIAVESVKGPGRYARPLATGLVEDRGIHTPSLEDLEQELTRPGQHERHTLYERLERD
jgi:hypothetical protein